MLEDCSLGDHGLDHIANSLENNTSIKQLVLSKNQISGKYIENFAFVLKYNLYIDKLDLHWNSISGANAVKLISGLKENLGIKELDLSFNSLGKNGDMSVAKTLAEFFIENKVVLHLDLSYNKMTAQQVTEITKGLDQN